MNELFNDLNDRQCDWIRRYSGSGFVCCVLRLGHTGDHQYDPLCEADAKIAGPWELNPNDSQYPQFIQ